MINSLYSPLLFTFIDMKYILGATFLLILFMNCNVSVDMSVSPDDEDIVATVDSTLNIWHQAAAQADLETYIGIMDSASVYIGTDASENWTRSEFEEFCTPYFAKKKTWDFTPLQRNIYLTENDETAWFDELLKTHMGTCRGSGVLVYKSGHWKLKHYVLSLTIPNDDIEAVKAAKKKNDEAFLASFE